MIFLEKSYFTRDNIFVWQKTRIICQYSLTVVRWYVYYGILWPSISFVSRPAAIPQYRKSRNASSCQRERMRKRKRERERERKLKLRANRLQAGESEVGRARTSLLNRSPW